ncbi:GNS1/SUR4 family protein [Ancylostoma caninum]|uniref:Elongation of very long chain fatty acids protein n=1 Tax=Ancylostoma caninum TaxID=29170 RepID=A0A368GAV9_ANCCA|nr:GNS1/SUR4 family protein [Ancylostoma caninum]
MLHRLTRMPTDTNMLCQWNASAVFGGGPWKFFNAIGITASPFHSCTFLPLKATIQKAMEKREAFSLRTTLFLWNASLAAFSIVGLVRFSEVVELGDTLFIVLRKKRLIFLHYYHHAAVLIYALHSAAEHSNPGRTFVFMNYLAHSCMYTYYALATFGIRLPRWVCSHPIIR